MRRWKFYQTNNWKQATMFFCWLSLLPCRADIFCTWKISHAISRLELYCTDKLSYWLRTTSTMAYQLATSLFFFCIIVSAKETLSILINTHKKLAVITVGIQCGICKYCAIFLTHACVRILPWLLAWSTFADLLEMADFKIDHRIQWRW